MPTTLEITGNERDRDDADHDDVVPRVEVMGDERDLEGLVQLVRRRFGVEPREGIETLDATEAPRVLYIDDSDTMAHAFARGLLPYVVGFVDSKVDGTLRTIETTPGSGFDDPDDEGAPASCGQCGATVQGFHACPGLPGENDF